MITSKQQTLHKINQMCANTLMQTLDIEFTDFGENFLEAKMPVNAKVHQPDGVLHGGATVALGESVGSAASILFVDREKYYVRGIEISANHLKSVKSGYVFAKAEMLHNGKTTQLWNIKVTDEEENLVSLIKLTTITLPKK
ncbi:PaaI family thioesterase [Mesonia sp. K7]|uniref:PaaI family thioesterase n=1 Tax=Mesonia sp. K7 TaxID=2218606 RepID=UPI000DA6EFFC|nr:hotdog fold thioesterase [Mesonia sp. K7]PZD78266.1 thioesterase [Mesonia sp. K7]